MARPRSLEAYRQARQAREQWLQAAEAGASHDFVQAKWEAYLALAHGGGVYMDLEHEFALKEKEVRS